MRKSLPFIAFGIIVLMALVTPFLSLPNPVTMNIIRRMASPSALHWLGTDEYGRDMLSRLLWGARISLAVAASTAVLACLIGGALGIVAGYFGGWVSAIIMRATDVVLCLPHLLVAMLVVTLFGPGLYTLIPVLVFVYIPSFVRVAQVSTAMIRPNAFVEAVGTLGARQVRILTRTILPNVAGPLLVQVSLTASSAIMLEAGLSFLGLGVQPPAPSWGSMIGNARGVMNMAPMLLVWPCLALVLAVLAINAVCDRLRDLLDPHQVARAPLKQTAAAIARRTASRAPANGNLVEIRNLDLALAGSGTEPVKLVYGVDLTVREGETLAIVGESGSGKSLTALALAGLSPSAVEVVGGSARLAGQDMLSLSEPELRGLRGAAISMVFQDPLSSLNPVHTVGRQLTEAILAHRPMSKAAAQAEANELLKLVGIPDPVGRAGNFPYEMSGGMRQRVMIAMAISNRPRVVIADEPTTALDVTVQAQILDLLRDLKEKEGIAMIFIAHSLPVVSEIADRVAVMYSGEIIEEGRADIVLRRPMHPYTRALIASSPEGDDLPEGIPGRVPPPADRPSGCVFRARCTHAADECAIGHPPLVSIGEDHRTRCIRWRAIA